MNYDDLSTNLDFYDQLTLYGEKMTTCFVCGNVIIDPRKKGDHDLQRCPSEYCSSFGKGG